MVYEIEMKILPHLYSSNKTFNRVYEIGYTPMTGMSIMIAMVGLWMISGLPHEWKQKQGHRHFQGTTRWCPPVISLFITPITQVIGVICTNLANELGNHLAVTNKQYIINRLLVGKTNHAIVNRFHLNQLINQQRISNIFHHLSIWSSPWLASCKVTWMWKIRPL